MKYNVTIRFNDIDLPHFMYSNVDHPEIERNIATFENEDGVEVIIPLFNVTRIEIEEMPEDGTPTATEEQ